MSESTMCRLDELQADRALWGLDPQDQAELELALQRVGTTADSSWEHSAAVTLRALQLDEPGPPSERLIESLRRAAPLPRSLPRSRQLPRLRAMHGRRGVVITLLAAAILVTSVLPWLFGTFESAPPAELRRALLEASTTSVWRWQDGPAAGAETRVAGDVVWDGASQRGYLRFGNLPVNDPSRRQYQLWIFDARRKAAHPVDGGVFDISNSGGEVVIPINPKIVVHEAQAFVITAEVPGGVVVSEREHVVVLAKPE